MIKEDDQLQQVCLRMGISYLRSNANQEALVLFDGLFVLFPKNIYIAALTALARLRCEQSKQALEITERLVRARRVKSSFWFLHAKALLQTGKKKESHKAFETYLVTKQKDEISEKRESEMKKARQKITEEV